MRGLRFFLLGALLPFAAVGDLARAESSVLWPESAPIWRKINPKLRRDWAIPGYPQVTLSFGARDNRPLQFGPPIFPIAFPLGFWVTNTGPARFPGEVAVQILFEGRLWLVSPTGLLRQRPVIPQWRTMVPDWLEPGAALECPAYAGLLDYFPGLPDGIYHAWWSAGSLQSNGLTFLVKNRLVLLSEETFAPPPFASLTYQRLLAVPALPFPSR